MVKKIKNIPLRPFKVFKILGKLSANGIISFLLLLSFKNFANFIIILFFFLISACEIANPEEAIPAYLKIEKFDFSTTPEQGTASEQITDVWVFVNDLSLGIYELPTTIPSLDVGNQNITIFPVIRENGIRSTPIIYPFYKRFETNIDLAIGETVIIKPTTTYVNNAIFELVEDFNSTGHLLRGGDANAIKVVDGVGEVQLEMEETIEFTSTGTFIDLPTNSGLAVFVEFDYKTNVELEVGLVGIDPSPTNPVNATIYNVSLCYDVALCPINRWNKVYINMQEILEVSQLPGYKLAFRVSPNTDTGAGSVTNNPPEVLLDNIKFIRLTN